VIGMDEAVDVEALVAPVHTPQVSSNHTKIQSLVSTYFIRSSRVLNVKTSSETSFLGK
jgi:hypothetical protein